MYPLLANYLGFYGICAELSLDLGQIAKFLQGYDTKIMASDRELWRLTTAARSAGLDPRLLRHRRRASSTGAAAHGARPHRLATFDEFLQVYGWRTEGSCDIALPSWNEDPTRPWG